MAPEPCHSVVDGLPILWTAQVCLAEKGIKKLEMRERLESYVRTFQKKEHAERDHRNSCALVHKFDALDTIMMLVECSRAHEGEAYRVPPPREKPMPTMLLFSAGERWSEVSKV
jgi:hypothetical protein